MSTPKAAKPAAKARRAKADAIPAHDHPHDHGPDCGDACGHDHDHGHDHAHHHGPQPDARAYL